MAIPAWQAYVSLRAFYDSQSPTTEDAKLRVAGKLARGWLLLSQDERANARTAGAALPPNISPPEFPVYSAIQRPGPQVIAVQRSLGVADVPIILSGDIDSAKDGVIDAADVASIAAACTQRVPDDYDGIAIWDYEDPYRGHFDEVPPNPVLDQSGLDIKLAVYEQVQGLLFANKPRARWMPWGLPKCRLSTPDIPHWNWIQDAIGIWLGDTVPRQFGHCPSIYDDRVGDDGARFATFLSRLLAASRGLSMYPFVRPRYINPTQHDPNNAAFNEAIPFAEFEAHVETAMAASATVNGVVVYPSGFVFFDGTPLVATDDEKLQLDTVFAVRLWSAHQLYRSIWMQQA